MLGLKYGAPFCQGEDYEGEMMCVYTWPRVHGKGVQY